MGKAKLISLSALMLLILTNATALKQWSVVGSPGFTANEAHFLSFAVDNLGTPWVAYQDTLKATVMKYDGTTWVVVGKAGFSPGTIYNISIAVGKKGTPYVAFSDNANGGKLTVMEYNGSSWVNVGSPGISTGVVGTISLTTDTAGTPYVAYMDNIGNSQLWVKKFNGTAWVQVGNAASKGLPDNVVLKFDNTNTPWVSYRDFAYNARLTVMKLNGSIWSNVGGYGFSMGNVSNSHFSIDNANTPYVAQVNFYSALNSLVQKYNGINWVDIGNNGIPTGSTDNYTSLAHDNNSTPYLAYSDYLNGGKITVMNFNGSSWANVGNIDFSSGGVSDITLAFDRYNNIPLVAYVDAANGNKATVMKFDCTPRPQVNICAAVVDTISSKNTIIWDGSASNVKEYKIYREDFGSYKLIGNVPGNVNTLVDPVANSSSQSYKYKLIVVDSCDGETNLNAAITHTTIRLAFNYLLNNQVSLTWNSYSGISNPTYTVKRSNNGGAYIPIAAFGITGTDTTFIDNNPPAGDNIYRIDIPLVSPCTSGTKSYNNITSNIATAWNTDIASIPKDDLLMLSPNPVTDKITVNFPQPIVSVTVQSMTGKILTQIPGNGTKETTIDLSALVQGVYILRVNDIYNATFVKR